MPLGIDDAIFGGALSLGGGLLSGLGGGESRRESRTVKNARADTRMQANRLLDAFYGSNWRGSIGATGEREQTDHEWDINKVRDFRYPGQAGAGRGPGGRSALWGGTTPFGNAPILQQLLGVSGQGQREIAKAQQDYEREQEGAMRDVAKYGTGQAAIIDADAAKALRDAQAVAMARLQGSGLGGSTLASDALGSISANNLREKARAKANLADRATGMKVQQRNTRAGGRAALQQWGTQANSQMRMLPIQAQMDVLNSRVANPFTPSLAEPQAQQNSTLANTLGNAAGALGGIYLAKSLYPTKTPQSNANLSINDLATSDIWNF